MELTTKEFKAMNHPLRQWLQRNFELPMLRKFRIIVENKAVLEIGCGSGYGARLLEKLHPASYTGVDLMPEQINIARQQNLPGYRFLVMDATDLCAFADTSFDLIVDFGILHHIPAWQRVLGECIRKLKPGGSFYLEEPDHRIMPGWDKLFHWGHPKQDTPLSMINLENELNTLGLSVKAKIYRFFFNFYHAVKPADGYEEARR